MPIFQNSVISKYLKTQDNTLLAKRWNDYKSHFHNVTIQNNIRNSKEEQYQGEFLIDLFVAILGYTKNPQPNFNLTTEYKNVKDSKKADGAILIDDKVRAVIELKGTNTTDLGKIEAQAFGYKNNQPDCIYIITSNFEKLRFYIDNAIEHIEFNLFTLTEKEFELLHLCLAYENLSKGIAKIIKEESVSQEDVITKKLYKDYSLFKRELYHNMVSLNPEYEPLELFKKSQKLLDRFLFIFFAEDRNLLPTNLIFRINKEWQNLRLMRIEVSLYERYKIYFNDLNSGAKVILPAFSETASKQIEEHQIFAYNGGLFKADEILDNIKIDDSVLFKHTEILSNYDFASEVDVNILGHIFENSLNELDEIKAELDGEVIDKTKTKRKKDGVFYTPKYITKYIVDNTVGKLCNDKKLELQLKEEDYTTDKKRQKKTLQALIERLQRYRNWLLQLTICDPACGSGAFLNQALDFLISEHRYIDELQAKLFGDAMVLSDVEKSILENNLFGVDLNEESVEIAKLSLWLRTAQPNRKLNDLNSNIKCGNSLIDDIAIADKEAFNWKDEFPQVFEKGGFDVIIGNPPYGILLDERFLNHYQNKFPLTKYKINLYVLFIERMFQVFNKGTIHFIIPKSLLFNSYYANFREFLIKNSEINEIYTITEKVFEDAEVGGSLLLKFTIKKEVNESNILKLKSAEKTQNFINYSGVIENSVNQNYFLTIPNFEISIVSNNSQRIIDKLNLLPTIKDNYSLKNGLNPGNVKHLLISNSKNSEKYKPIIWGKDISKYRIEWSGEYINYDENLKDTFDINQTKSKEGMKKQERIDFALRSPELFETNKIVIRKTGDSLIGSIDDENYYFDTLVHGIYQKNDDYTLEYLLVILNSKVATKFYRLLHDIKGKVFAKISLDNLSSFPLPESTSNKNIFKEKATEMIALNRKLQEETKKFQRTIQRKFELEVLPKKLQDWYLLSYGDFIKELSKLKIKLTLSEEAEWEDYFTTEATKLRTIKTQIETTDKEIDAMVYELYGLTKEEIEIVEKS